MRLLTFLRRIAVWMCRIRHRCGYGIHSPFAFQFVTNVIYERSAYYAYAPLRAVRRQNGSPLREKDDQLLLRIANATAPHTALVWGKDTTTTLRYLQAGRASCHYHHVKNPSLAPTAPTFTQISDIDFLYVDDDQHWPSVVRHAAIVASPKACFVIHGIHRNSRSRSAWREVRADAHVRVTFDLYDFGIVFFEARLNKQDYVVNYF